MKNQLQNSLQNKIGMALTHYYWRYYQNNN